LPATPPWPRAVLTAAHRGTAVKDLRVRYRDGAGQPVLIDVEAVAVHPGLRADPPTKGVVSVDLGVVQTQTPLEALFSAVELAAATWSAGSADAAAGPSPRARSSPRDAAGSTASSKAGASALILQPFSVSEIKLLIIAI
jgi:hypothetical protein